MVASWRSRPERARSRRPSGGRSTTETAGAASRDAGSGSARDITSVTGRKEALPRSRISPCCAAGHHRAVHEEGYQVDRQPDGELRFRRPDGRVLPEVPPPLDVLGDPVEILRGQHDAEVLVLHARTATPGWLGERLDVGWAIDVLHPLSALSRD